MNAVTPMHETDRLAHFPVSLISVVMGLTGLAIAWQKAQHALGASPLVWLVLAVLASATCVALLTVAGVVGMIVIVPEHPTWVSALGLLLPIHAALLGAALAQRREKTLPK